MSPGTQHTALAALGVSPIEEAAYRALLRAPGSTTAQLSERLAMPAQTLSETVLSLVRKGFVTHAPGQEARLIPSPPDIAIESLVLQRLRDLQRARLEIQALQRERPQDIEHSPIVQVIDADPSAQALPYAQSHQRAVKEVLCLVRPPFLVSSPDKGEDYRAAARARGVRYRNIVHPDTLSIEGWADTVRQDMEAGEEIRLLAEFPFKMIVSDREMGLLPLQIDDPRGPMLLLRNSAVLDALCDLFEHLWTIATPVTFNADGSLSVAAKTPYPPKLESLVPLLASGANDKLIADKLGMSERTLMRRIDTLYQTLSARSRFQAGWLAAMRTHGLA